MSGGLGRDNRPTKGRTALEGFETYRAYLFSIAYRMLGSVVDAEDMVQETFVRFQATPLEGIRSHKAFLTTILTRLCIDQLQLARRTREVYVGAWLPEPILTAERDEEADPEKRIEKQESISLAFLVLMEQLQPFERAVFLLHEVFVYEFSEIAEMLGKSESACRRSCSRARLHLRAHRPRFPASPQTHEQLLRAYFRAVETGELVPLMNLLSEDVTLWADGGGKTVAAVLRPIHGTGNVARVSLGSRRFWPEAYTGTIEEVNGQPAIVVRDGEQAFCVVAIDVEDGKVQTIRIIVNPEKLARI
ncbi:MAG: RNA polymerase sigma-70 factor [Chloroflexia bacterium]